MKPKIHKELSQPQLRVHSDVEIRQPRTASNQSLKEKQMNAKLNCQPLPADLNENKIYLVGADLRTPLITIDLLIDSQKSNHVSNSKHLQQASNTNTYSLPPNSLRSNNSSKRENTSTREASIRLTGEVGKDETIILPKKRNTTGSRAHQRVMSAGSSPRHFYQKIMGARVPLCPSKSNNRSKREGERQASEHKTLSSLTAINIDETNTSHKEPETESSASISKTYYKKKIANKLLSKNTSASLSCLTSRSNTQSKMNNTTNFKSPRQLTKYEGATVKLNSARSPRKDESIVSQNLPSSRLVSPESKSLSKEPKIVRPTKSIAAFHAVEKNIESQPSGSKRKENAHLYGINPKRISLDAEKKSPRLDGSKSSRAATGRNIPLLHFDRLESNPAQITSSKSQQNINFKTPQSTYFKPIEDFKLDEFIHNTRYSRGTSQKNDENLKVLVPSNTNGKQQKPPKPEKPSLSIVNTPSAATIPSYQMLSERNMNKENTTISQKYFQKEDKKSRKDVNSEIQLKEQPKQIAPVQNHYGILTTPRLEMMSLSNKKSLSDRPRSKELTRRSKLQENDDIIKHLAESNQKENHMHSPKRGSDENLSTTDSLSVTKTSKKKMFARIIGEKISPKGKLVNPERNIKTYSRLDELLKTLKDEKMDQSADSSIKGIPRSPDKDLFANSFRAYAGKEEGPFVLPSTKGLAQILMSRNENI